MCNESRNPEYPFVSLMCLFDEAYMIYTDNGIVQIMWHKINNKIFFEECSFFPLAALFSVCEISWNHLILPKASAGNLLLDLTKRVLSEYSFYVIYFLNSNRILNILIYFKKRNVSCVYTYITINMYNISIKLVKLYRLWISTDETSTIYRIIKTMRFKLEFSRKRICKILNMFLLRTLFYNKAKSLLNQYQNHAT